ncbi:hypothetical protein DXG03_007528 [Asterophora parasitica]|uniref:Uncharacterized protein n=1 Tax=Asterophora parasitica TaxID=117018 RepID=A0A9P7FYM0_9AGAR|nr:hypothetical protein DXG03_007528 [Asterophora parasitica]
MAAAPGSSSGANACIPPISDVWKEKNLRQMIGVLDSRGVEWTSMDLVRFGDVGLVERISDAPVVVWIGVKPDTLSGEDGLAAAKECKQILVANGILDVEVEMRESVVVLLLSNYGLV